MLNPYAKFLGDKDPLQVIASTPGKLREVIEAIGAHRTEQSPARGKWSAREIVCHLADCEVVFAFRLRQTLAEDDHVIQPFDQDKWAKTYSAYDVRTALAAFSAIRDWNLALIKSTQNDGMSKKLTHPERGEMTFRTVVETMAGHDVNHVLQIEAIAGRVASAR